MSLILPTIGFSLISASILALASVGFTLQFGVTNILNLAFAEVMMSSAFVAYWVNSRGISIWIGMAVAGVFGAIFSLLINRFLYRPFIRRGAKLFALIIVSIGLALIIQNGVLAITGPGFFTYNQPQGLAFDVAGIRFTYTELAILLIALLAMVGVHVLLTRTRLGKAMRACSADSSLARCSGVPTTRIVDIAWLLSGALAGIAGVTLFMNTSAFSVTTSGNFLVVIIAAAILGGVGDAYGAMLGALIIGFATEFSALLLNSSYKTAIAFVLLVVVLLTRPQGVRAAFASAREVQT
jgi:branched-chain amino acid transport system permease protein/neutral amino acid transport system permease protein